MTRTAIAAMLVTGFALAGVRPAQAEIRLTLSDGRVTIDAKDATVRQILTEWGRVGQTKFVNVERLTGAPITMQLNDMPEAQALEILLRAASGYMLAPRAVPVANLSRFDRILVLPTSTPPRGGSSAGTVAPAAPPQQAQFPPGLAPGETLDDDPTPPAGGAIPGQRPGVAFPPSPFPGGAQQQLPAPGGAAQRAPIFPQQPSPFPVPGGPGAVPQTPPGFPGGAAPGGAVPAAGPRGAMPVGVAVPGMVVQPVVPGNPGQSNEPQ